MAFFMRFLSALLCTLLFFSPVAVFAEAGVDEDYERMLELSDEATDAVISGEFALGAVRFRQAYQAFPDPILLKNEMIAWYRAGDCGSALPPAQAFLRTDDVQPEDQSDVETVQVECHLLLAQGAIDEGSPALASHHLDGLEPLELDDEAQARRLALRSELDRITPAPADQGAMNVIDSGNRDRGWMQVVAGVAVIGVGLSLHTVALDRQAQLRQFADSEAPTDGLILQRRQEDWGSFQRTTRWLIPTLYIVGAGAVGSGVYSLLRSSKSDSEMSLLPSLSPDGVGLGFSTRF